MRLLCRLGRHAPVRVAFRRHVESPWLTSFSNAACRRCNKRMWVNWPPLAEDTGGSGSAVGGDQ